MNSTHANHTNRTSLRGYSGRALRFGWKVSGSRSGPSRTLNCTPYTSSGLYPQQKELVHGGGVSSNATPYSTKIDETLHHHGHGGRGKSPSKNLRPSSIFALWRRGELRPDIMSAIRLRGSRGPHRVDVSS